MNTKSLYENELKDEFDLLKDIDIASDAHRQAVTDISQLTDRLVKLKEVENEKRKIEIEREKFELERVRIETEKEKVAIEREKIGAEKEKVAIERKKVDLETHKIEIEEKRLEEDLKDRWIKNVLAGLSVIIPAGITIVGTVLMFRFEEQGTITGKASNKIVDRIFRK